MKDNKIIFVAGGGTGGHLFPAISIGKTLEKRGIKILYIGSKYGVEKEFYRKYNLNYFLLPISGIQRSFSIEAILKNILFPIKFLISYIKSVKLIIKYKPNAIIGTGGYSSGLPLIAGIHLKIPTFIQDQNSIPGLVTRKLHKKVSKVFLGYKSAIKNLNSKNLIITGNPIRKELNRLDKIESKINLNFSKNKKLIFINGGSQGARPINMHIFNKINFYLKNEFQLLWQCGEFDFDYLNKQINHKNIKIKKFINDMSPAYSAADLIISRAGALTINEITFFGKASILIPYPQAAENHQYFNAEELNIADGCKIVKQRELKNGQLEKYVDKLFHHNNISYIEKNSKNTFKPNATNLIANEVENVISC